MQGGSRGIGRGTALGFAAAGADVAVAGETVGATTHLASDTSRFVTGETIYLNGGWAAA